MGVYLAFQHNDEPLNTGPAQWNDVRVSASAQALVDEDNVATSFTVTTNLTSGFIIGGNAQPTGSAAWVDEEAVWKGAHGVGADDYGTLFYSINGLNDASVYDLEIFGSVTSTGRTLGANVNGGAEQTLLTTNNTTSTLIFAGVSPVSGAITVNLRTADGGNAYINASRISAAAAVPTITLTQTEITPGGTISGSYSNWGGTAPTKLEGIRGANSIGTDTGEITGFTVTGDGTSGTFTATIEDLTESGSAQYLRFSDTGIVDATWRLS
jgi:hypothetical protein